MSDHHVSGSPRWLALAILLVACDPGAGIQEDDDDGRDAAQDALADSAPEATGGDMVDAELDGTADLDAEMEEDAEEAGLDAAAEEDSGETGPDACQPSGQSDCDAQLPADGSLTADASAHPMTIPIPPPPDCPAPAAAPQVVIGTVTIDSEERLATLASVTRIEGDLFINPARVRSVTLPLLEQVTGRIGFVFSFSVISTDPNMPGAGVSRRDPDVLETINLPALRSAKSLKTSDVPGLRSVDLRCLSQTAEDVIIGNILDIGLPLKKLEHLDLRSLATATEIRVEATIPLVLPSVTDFPGRMCGLGLTGLAAPELTRVGTLCAVSNTETPKLTEADTLSGCLHPTTPLRSVRALYLTPCSYPNLVSVEEIHLYGSPYGIVLAGDITFSDLSLSSVGPPPQNGPPTSLAVHGVISSRTLSGGIPYGSLTFSDMREIESVLVKEAATAGPTQPNDPSLRISFPALQSAGTFELRGSYQVPYVDVPMLRTIDELLVSTTSAHPTPSAVTTNLSFPEVTTIGALRTCTASPGAPPSACNIGTLSFPKLTRVELLAMGAARGGRMLPPELPLLREIGPGMSFLHVEGPLELPRLASVGGELSLSAPSAVRIPALTDVAGALSIDFSDPTTLELGQEMTVPAVSVHSQGAAEPICSLCRELAPHIVAPPAASLACTFGQPAMECP